jgi:intracellular septation protein A
LSEAAAPVPSGLAIAKYRRRFSAGEIACQVVVTARTSGLESILFFGDEPVARDKTPAVGPDAIRNHRLSATLPDGSRIEVDAGYVSWVNVGIRVRRDGVTVHQSHPGKTIAYPARAAKAVVNAKNPQLPPGYDPGVLRRNKVPILVDLALGLLFYVVAKLTDLSTAALIGAAMGLALVVVQRFVKVDLIGGLALFGVFMLLVSAGLALAFQDDMAVKMRTSIVGVISAVLFLGDGLLGGNRLGKGLSRYLPYSDIDPGRLALGMGLAGLVMAALNYVVATTVSTSMWLFYTTFVDFVLMMGLIILVFRYARGQMLAPRSGRMVPAEAEKVDAF